MSSYHTTRFKSIHMAGMHCKITHTRKKISDDLIRALILDHDFEITTFVIRLILFGARNSLFLVNCHA